MLPDLRLVCVGSFGEATIKRYGPDRLHVLGPLPDRELETLLSGAVAFVYPSLYEGFGLPVVEAMQMGVPVVTSQDAAIREVAATAALHVDVTSTQSLAASRRGGSQQLSVASRSQSQRYSAFLAVQLAYNRLVDPPGLCGSNPPLLIERSFYPRSLPTP